MAAPHERRRAATGRVSTALLAAVWLLTAAASAEDPDPTSWTADQCQCDADPAVVALCDKASFYPDGIATSVWEGIGDQYYQIVKNATLSDEERRAEYTPLMNDSGLFGANFTQYADKYVALKDIPSAEQLSSSSSYCSVRYNSETGLMPCQCTGGGMAELTLTLTDPASNAFQTDADNSKQRVLAVLEEKLRATLGLWFSSVAINKVQGANVNVHITYTTLSKSKIEQRFASIETLLVAGKLTLADESQEIELGTSTLNQRVLVCTGAALSPTSDLPAEAEAVSSEDVISGASARFQCPSWQRFSNGVRTVSRRCTGQEQLEATAAEPLTCVNETVTVTEAPVQTSAAPGPSSSDGLTGSSSVGVTGSSSSVAPSSSSELPDGSSSTYEPEHYEEINVEWNDGKSFKKVDPNKPNLLMRITVPAASVIFVMLVLYLLCTRPSSCMCNACGGGKLEEVK